MRKEGEEKQDTGEKKKEKRARSLIRRKPLALQKKKKLNQTVRDKCFAKCITKPSNSLSSGEQTCLSRCCDRYSDATQAVLKSVLEHSGLS